MTPRLCHLPNFMSLDPSSVPVPLYKVKRSETKKRGTILLLVPVFDFTLDQRTLSSSYLTVLLRLSSEPVVFQGWTVTFVTKHLLQWSKRDQCTLTTQVNTSSVSYLYKTELSSYKTSPFPGSVTSYLLLRNHIST